MFSRVGLRMVVDVLSDLTGFRKNGRKPSGYSLESYVRARKNSNRNYNATRVQRASSDFKWSNRYGRSSISQRLLKHKKSAWACENEVF